MSWTVYALAAIGAMFAFDRTEVEHWQALLLGVAWPLPVTFLAVSYLMEHTSGEREVFREDVSEL